MLHIEIPGRAPMDIANVVFDYNGTIAVDGKVLPELRERIEALLKLVPVYVLTADTYGTVRAQCEPLGMIVHTFPREGAAQCKEEIVKSLPVRGRASAMASTISKCSTRRRCPSRSWRGRACAPRSCRTRTCWCAARQRGWTFF